MPILMVCECDRSVVLITPAAVDIIGFATGKFFVNKSWFFEANTELYLLTLGVAKEHQRKGLCVRLLPRIHRIDRRCGERTSAENDSIGDVKITETSSVVHNVACQSEIVDTYR